MKDGPFLSPKKGKTFWLSYLGLRKERRFGLVVLVNWLVKRCFLLHRFLRACARVQSVALLVVIGLVRIDLNR